MYRLPYYQFVGNDLANDALLIRGHFDGDGRLIPEKVVGYGVTGDDRGVRSIKVIRVLLGYRK